MRTARSLRISYLTMLKRALVVIDVKNSENPCFLEDWSDGEKSKIEIISIVDSEKEILHHEIGFKRCTPYRESHTSGNFLDVRSHRPCSWTEELKHFLRWHIGGLADEKARQTVPFIMNLKGRASLRFWTDRSTKTIQVSESRGWVVPPFISLTVDPKDLELYYFFLLEARLNRKWQSRLRQFVLTVNYHTRSHKTIRGRGFGEIRKILTNQREFLKQAALEEIVPQIARKDLFLEWLQAERLITERQAGELSRAAMPVRSGSGFYLNAVHNGFKKSGCVSFRVFGGNRIPEPHFNGKEVASDESFGEVEEEKPEEVRATV
ncbi:MAG TPA: hypothetical protein VJL09_00085 [Candidatus Paceibacterota bacterium]